MKEYKKNTMTLHNKLQWNFKVHGHEGTDLISSKFNALMWVVGIATIIEIWTNGDNWWSGWNGQK